MKQDKEVLKEVLQFTAEYFKITIQDIIGGVRKAELVDARSVYAIVALKYVNNKKRIAKYIHSDASTCHNWLKRPRNRSVNDGVFVVTAKMENGVERYEYEQMLKEFDRKMEEHFAFTQQLQKLKQKIEKQKERLV